MSLGYVDQDQWEEEVARTYLSLKQHAAKKAVHCQARKSAARDGDPGAYYAELKRRVAWIKTNAL